MLHFQYSHVNITYMQYINAKSLIMYMYIPLSCNTQPYGLNCHFIHYLAMLLHASANFTFLFTFLLTLANILYENKGRGQVIKYT